MRDPLERLKSMIVDVPDYPKPGITFRDITPLLASPPGLALAVELMANPFRGKGVDIVVGAESRGFIFGIAVAQTLSAGFAPIRKPGKLPRAKRSCSYDLEYGKDTLEVHADAVRPGQRVLLIDDLIATGGTMGACLDLIEGMRGDLVGVAVLIELKALEGRSKLNLGDRLHAVLQI